MKRFQHQSPEGPDTVKINDFFSLDTLEYMENSLFVDLVDENKKFYHDSCVPAPTHFLWYFFIVAA